MTIHDLYRRSAELLVEHRNAVDCRDWERAARLKAEQHDINFQLRAAERGKTVLA